jgi:hypothetical protein
VGVTYALRASICVAETQLFWRFLYAAYLHSLAQRTLLACRSMRSRSALPL